MDTDGEDALSEPANNRNGDHEATHPTQMQDTDHEVPDRKVFDQQMDFDLTLTSTNSTTLELWLITNPRPNVVERWGTRYPWHPIKAKDLNYGSKIQTHQAP